MIKRKFGPVIKAIVFSVLVGGWMFGWTNSFADDPEKIVEIGEVNWSSDLESAQRKSGKTGRPVFLLFQEIPG